MNLSNEQETYIVDVIRAGSYYQMQNVLEDKTVAEVLAYRKIACRFWNKPEFFSNAKDFYVMCSMYINF